MSDLNKRLEELRADPSHWSMYDETTRELLREQARGANERSEVHYDPATGVKTLEPA